MLDVRLTGRSVLIVLVVAVGLFLAMFAPSLIAIVLIFLMLSLLAYGIWVLGVRVNRRLTGRKASLERIADGND